MKPTKFIVGTDIEQGVYNIKVTETGQLFDTDDGKLLGQLSPWVPDLKVTGTETGRVTTDRPATTEVKRAPSQPEGAKTDSAGGSGPGVGEDNPSGLGKPTS